jgi:hypothetical protein
MEIKPGLIYLAIPYTSDSPETMAFRAEVSDLVYSELTKQGYIIYPPITVNHLAGIKYGMPKDWKFWREFDLAFVRVCSELYVVTLPGWGTSTGVTDEIKNAKELGIPISYIDPTPFLNKLDPYYMKRVYLDGTVKPLVEEKRRRGRPKGSKTKKEEIK